MGGGAVTRTIHEPFLRIFAANCHPIGIGLLALLGFSMFPQTGHFPLCPTKHASQDPHQNLAFEGCLAVSLLVIH